MVVGAIGEPSVDVDDEDDEDDASSSSSEEEQEEGEKGDDEELRRLKTVYNEILGELGPSKVGAATSRKERSDLGLLEDDTLRYAEAGFDAVFASLKKIKDTYGAAGRGASGDGVLQTSGGVFADLGSGSGKACLAAALSHRFEKCFGVETLEGLHVLATAVKGQYDATKQEDAPRLAFFRGSIAKFDVAFSEVVLVHAACFDEKLMGTVGRRLATMQKGSFVIAVANELPPKSTSKDGFKLLDTSIIRDGTPGGFESLVHLYQKKTRPPEQ